MIMNNKKTSKNCRMLKNKGLSNRFPPEVKEWWMTYHPYTDMIDGRNDGDVLHHIKSPSSSDYVAGEHNLSLLNSTMLNNFRNHIGNGKIHKKEYERELIMRTFNAVLDSGYMLDTRDQEFLRIYKITS